uniref:ATP synthase gamma chain n=1 Tax=uncultured bacterium contig00031 TaxID=1181520 RepID=A0A806KED8_9BACT|nr:ATP synthase gamma chain [uncultured bacterium contig00031]
MANLRDVRLRMRAIEQTLQVTKAMKLISTAKLRKGRKMLMDTEPYFKRIKKSMFDIFSGTSTINSDFFRRKNPPNSPHTAIVVINSDKGLAGGYNANIFRQVNDLCTRVKNPALVLVGSIGFRYFTHSTHVILENFSFHSQIPTVEHAGEIAEYLVSQYLWGMFDDIHIVYTYMFNAIKMVPVEWQIMPLNMEQIQKELTEIGLAKREGLRFEYLPSVEAVFDVLVPQYIKGVVYGALVEAYASEQNARMTAMDEASKSAEDMLDELRISYNRARQAGITQEMSEIIGGSSAL